MDIKRWGWENGVFYYMVEGALVPEDELDKYIEKEYNLVISNID